MYTYTQCIHCPRATDPSKSHAGICGQGQSTYGWNLMPPLSTHKVALDDTSHPIHKPHTRKLGLELRHVVPDGASRVQPLQIIHSTLLLQLLAALLHHRWASIFSGSCKLQVYLKFTACSMITNKVCRWS